MVKLFVRWKDGGSASLERGKRTRTQEFCVHILSLRCLLAIQRNHQVRNSYSIKNNQISLDSREEVWVGEKNRTVHLYTVSKLASKMFHLAINFLQNSHVLKNKEYKTPRWQDKWRDKILIGFAN